MERFIKEKEHSFRMINLIKRDIEEEIIPWLDAPQIIAIRGTRQCGKTTLLKKIIEILQKRNITKKEIYYVSFEDELEQEKFENNPKEYVQYYTTNEEGKKHFFLFDEVQYIKNAGKLLKMIYDTFDNIKIIITGSSTLDLNEIGSFLVGRVLLFEMYPFSFSEFLRTKDERICAYHSRRQIDLKKPPKNIEQPLFLKELNASLKEYITYGGYPAVVLEPNVEKKKTLLKNLFLTYIEKDITKVYGLKYKRRVSDLIRHLASINAGIVNYDELASLSGLYSKEVKEVLAILEDTYVIQLIRPFHKNLTTELRKNPKIYFIDMGLRNFITGRFEFSEEEQGKLLENYVLHKLRTGKINYWRTTAKAEVDFIFVEQIPIEVKMRPKITRSFRSFIETYKPKRAFLANRESYEKRTMGKTTIYFVPLALL